MTATYSIGGEQKLRRRESEVNYQFRSDYERFPKVAINTTKGGRTLVTWEGSFAARSSGTHTFSLFNSEYAKLWIDGKLVKDTWRQNWKTVRL